MLKRYFPLLLFICLTLSSCYTGYTSGKEFTEADWFSPKDTLKIWALADIQPENRGDEEAFEDAVEDINENVSDIDLAIVAGDIVHETEEQTFDWYVSEKNKSYIKEWYEIIGNHDLKTDKGKLFREKLREEVNYSSVKGNILFIFMSDAQRGKATEIPDDVFNWWKELVINNQDKIIIVTTHAPLEGSGIPFSSFTDRQIINSERFTDVMQQYRVDLWLSGHLHLPHSIMNNIVEQEEYGGTVFIHVSSIRPELLGMKESESRVLTFACGSDKVLVQVRNHKDKTFIPHMDRTFTLSKMFKCDNE